MRLRTALLAFVLATLALPAFAQDADRAPAPDFRVGTLDGSTATLGEHAGKVVVISFWATWCRPCLQELPHLQRLYAELGDEGLVVLAVSNDGPETQAQVRAIANRGGWTFPVLLDLDGAITSLLNPRGTNPYTIFVDRQGRIADTHEGYASGDEVQHEATIRALLAEPAP
jgi:peroxiredoxin